MKTKQFFINGTKIGTRQLIENIMAKSSTSSTAHILLNLFAHIFHVFCSVDEWTPIDHEFVLLNWKYFLYFALMFHAPHQVTKKSEIQGISIRTCVTDCYFWPFYFKYKKKRNSLISLQCVHFSLVAMKSKHKNVIY